MFVCEDGLVPLENLKTLREQGQNDGVSPRGFQTINKMNTHDFCGTDLVAGLLLETLHLSAEKLKTMSNALLIKHCPRRGLPSV